MSLIAKIHSKDERTIVSVCDKDLLGSFYEENGVQLDLRGEFYKGRELDNKEVGDLLRNADGVNLVGEEAVKLGLAEEVIDDSQVLIVDGVPHAQGVVLSD